MVSLCIWLSGLVMRTDGWHDPAVRRQSERACEDSESSGGAGSSRGPSHGWLLGRVFGSAVGSHMNQFTPR